MSAVERTDAYLIVKRGLYYKPRSQGYIGIRDLAGRFPLAEVAILIPNRESPNQDGMTFIHEDDAPEFSEACWDDVKAKWLMQQRDEARADVSELKRQLGNMTAAAQDWWAKAEKAEDRYQREVHGLNNEGDPIGGDPPAGWKLRAERAEAELAGCKIALEQAWASNREREAELAALRAHPGAGEVKPLAEAAQDVLAERQRQISAEGWTPAHDDQHDQGEMATAAATYAFNAFIGAGYRAFAADPLGFWPWDQEWFKPTHPYRDLEKAGALILAEMERLNRAALADPAGEARG